MEKHPFKELRKKDVNEKIEKKNGLSYLSWAWAVDTLLQEDPSATWEYKEDKKYGDTVMVFCTVTAFGKSMTAQLPVMNYMNKAITNPDAFAVNTAMQRCLAKAIALHGIGLYIYAGEDIPNDDTEVAKEPKKRATKEDIEAFDQSLPPKPIQPYIGNAEAITLFQMIKERGITQDAFRDYLKLRGIEGTNKIKKEDYTGIVEWIMKTTVAAQVGE